MPQVSPNILILTAIFTLLTLGETLFPLRIQTQSKIHRMSLNFGLALISFALVRLTLFSVLIRAFEFSNPFGISFWAVSDFFKLIGSLLVLDYTFYWWHRFNHHKKTLWRFHGVHHTDLDMDVTTAFRFHFGELFLSVIYRFMQIVVLGISIEVLLTFEFVVLIAIMFHHSNLKIPLFLENTLRLVFVTPKMHESHHSIIYDETNSNFGTIFSFWDRIHRTYKILPNLVTVIGIPAIRTVPEVRLQKLITMPFKPVPKWQLPDKTVPTRN